MAGGSNMPDGELLRRKPTTPKTLDREQDHATRYRGGGREVLGSLAAAMPYMEGEGRRDRSRGVCGCFSRNRKPVSAGRWQRTERIRPAAGLLRGQRYMDLTSYVLNVIV